MNLLKTAVISVLSLSLAFSTTNCKKKEVEKDKAVQKGETGCLSGNQSLTDAIKQSVGVWKLVTIKSGWTSEITKPNKTLLIFVDSQQNIKVSEESEVVDQFKLTLSKLGKGVYYKVTNRSTDSKGIHISEGEFKVCDEKLVLDNTALDGPAYTFEKQP